MAVEQLSSFFNRTETSREKGLPKFSADGGIILLAPTLAGVPEAFGSARLSPRKHAELLADMQRLRGRIYCEDGAIPSSSLTGDGRHVQSADAESWHVLATDSSGQVQGCARYRDCGSSAGFNDLHASASALAASDVWGGKLRRSVEHAIEDARERDLAWVEVGGWALSSDLRCSTRALGIAFATWALGELLGGCLGITTATRRHCSASILRRVGGRPFRAEGQDLPAYFDPLYGCDMEVLHFDSSSPNPRFASWIDEWTAHLATVPVVCASAGLPLPVWPGFATDSPALRLSGAAEA